MLTNKEILITTRESLKGSWGFFILSALIYWALYWVFESIADGIILRPTSMGYRFWEYKPRESSDLEFTSIFAIIGIAPLSIGYAKILLGFERAKEDSKQFKTMFWGFKHTFLSSIVVSFLATLIIMLGVILLVIPGIIFALAYAQICLILADTQYIQYRPLALSKAFMQGKKKKLLYIWLLFFVLGLLSILTLGIALLWIAPYFYAVSAKFYTEIEKDFLAMNNGSIPESYLKKSHREEPHTKTIVEK